MNFNDCLAFEKAKGTYVIVVKEPLDSICPVPVKFLAVDFALGLKLMTNSTYIGHTDKQIILCASYALNSKSKSNYIKIEPDEFTVIEVDYSYYIHDGSHCVDKVILNQINNK